jgi:hypothetical protein
MRGPPGFPQDRVHANARIREKREALLVMDPQFGTFGVAMIENNPSDALSKGRCPEIDEQAELKIEEPQVSQGLLAVNGKQGVHRLEFDQEATFHKEVSSKRHIECLVSQNHRDGHLPLHGVALLFETVRKDSLVDGLKKSGTNLMEKVIRDVNGFPGEQFGLHGVSSKWRLRMAK